MRQAALAQQVGRRGGVGERKSGVIKARWLWNSWGAMRMIEVDKLERMNDWNDECRNEMCENDKNKTKSNGGEYPIYN